MSSPLNLPERQSGGVDDALWQKNFMDNGIGARGCLGRML
jgi:hypothetical protein